MAQVQRPLSPHLQVYRWQVSNTLSILHRLTGVVLAAAVELVPGQAKLKPWLKPSPEQVHLQTHRWVPMTADSPGFRKTTSPSDKKSAAVLVPAFVRLPAAPHCN